MDLKTIFGSKEAPEGISALDTAAEAAPVQEEKQKPVKTPVDPSLLSSTAQGQMNTAISAAVSEAVSMAVKGIFAELRPILEAQSKLPDLIDAIHNPKPSAAAVAKLLREERESTKSRADDAQNRRNQKAMQDNCAHLDDAGNDAIGLIRNYPDRQVRGICMKCSLLINPTRYWAIDAPYPLDYLDKNLAGKEHAYIATGDPVLYARVLRLAAKS